VPSSDNSNNDLPNASGQEPEAPLEALRHNAQILEMLTAVVSTAVAKITDAQRESSEARLTGIESRLSCMERLGQEQTAILRTALARPADPASAAEPVPRQVLQMERSMLWSFEAGREGPKALRLPRPSIIGRALYDLQREAAGYEGSTPADIYQMISARGPHHLSETAQKYVTRYRAGETSNVSGKMGIHLKPRFEALAKPTDRRPYAEQTGERRYLTGHGITIFSNWPHWDARDEDLTGDGPGTPGSPPPVGGTGTT
jgi:hypothetical protein